MAKRCLAIIPAFNEAGAVGDVIRAIQRERPDVDVAVIDDGSRDATAKVAREAGAIVLQLPFNLGIGESETSPTKLFPFVHYFLAKCL